MPPPPPRRSWRKSAGFAAAVSLVLLTSPTPQALQAQPLARSEALLKARLTLSLTRFTQWPAAASGDALRLCVAHSDPFTAQAFAETDGQVVNSRRIQVVRAPPLVGCHVLYIDGTAERVSDLIRSASASPVLIVGDAEGMLVQGAMVEFVPVNDSIRFDVNMAAVRKGQLTISSQALRLARQVRE